MRQLKLGRWNNRKFKSNVKHSQGNFRNYLGRSRVKRISLTLANKYYDECWKFANFDNSTTENTPQLDYKREKITILGCMIRVRYVLIGHYRRVCSRMLYEYKDKPTGVSCAIATASVQPESPGRLTFGFVLSGIYLRVRSPSFDQLAFFV